MAAILAVTTIFSPVLAGEFSSPEEITEEFSDGQENQDYKNEISDDMPQIQNEDGEGVSATESETEREIVVKTDDQFKDAVNNSSVDIIRISGKIGFDEKKPISQLPPGKKIIIESGYIFKITSGMLLKEYTTNIEICDGAKLIINSKNQSGQIWLKGIIKNNGSIEADGSGDVYVNYQENLGKINDKLKINILQDGMDKIEVSIPQTVTAGDTITPTITGMIPGSENKASEIFKGKWESNGNSLEETGISYTVPVNTGKSKIKLMLILNEKYGALKQNGAQKSTSWSNECTIEKKTLDTIYVDNNNGNDQNTGESETTPVKTFSRALEGIKNGGTIILLSDCETKTVYFDKTVTVTGKSNDSSVTLTGNRDWYIDPNITVTLNNVSIKTAGIFQYKASGEPGNLVLDTVKNANIEEINGLSAVTLNDSKIACPTIKANKVELKNTELNGRFLADNLTIDGKNTLIYTLNSPGEIVQGITGTGKLKVRLNDIGQKELRGIKVLEVPEAMSEISNIELDSSYGKQYELKIRKYYNGNYMYISEGIDPQIDLYVGNEPRDKENVDMSSGENISVNAKMTNFSGVHMSVVGNWSGYSGGGNTVWSGGDDPVLTVKVTLTDSEYNNYHFNQIQNFANLINVYSWKDTNTVINKDVKSKATVTVKNDQGISADGRYCTFTLTYPKVKYRASISISADSLDKVYDGNAVASPAITVPEKVNASLKWYQKNGADWTEIDAAPRDAGEYSVMAYAEESEKYEAGYSERVEFTISKAQNEWTVNPAINNWTSDQTPSKPAGKAKFGTVSFSYSDKKDGTYTETQPTSSGSWYMKATVAGNDNYDGLEKIIPFTIYTPYYPPIVIPTATPTPSPTPTVKPVPDNYPDGSEYLPDGSIKTPNGTIVDSDGEITLPNGVIVKPGNEENKPTLNKENGVITGDGTLVIRPGLSELETGAGWKIFSDGRIVDTDGNVYAMDGSVSDKDGNCVKPAKAMIKNAYTYKNKNQVKVVLYDSCKGAQGYDYVIGKSSNMLKTKEYEKVNKNRKGLKTTFTYMDKGTWYVACHAWVKDANGKKTFGEWSEVKTVVVNAKTPSQPRIISVKTNGSTITVKFSKTGKATGAEVVLGKELEKLYGEKRPVEYKRYVIEEDEDVTTVTFKNVKKGTYYLSLRKWNRTADNNEKVFGPWAEYVKANVK